MLATSKNPPPRTKAVDAVQLLVGALLKSGGAKPVLNAHVVHKPAADIFQEIRAAEEEALAIQEAEAAQVKEAGQQLFTATVTGDSSSLSSTISAEPPAPPDQNEEKEDSGNSDIAVRLYHVFHEFARFGSGRRTHTAHSTRKGSRTASPSSQSPKSTTVLMDNTRFMKLVRETQLIDKRLTSHRADLIFTKCVSAKPKTSNVRSLSRTGITGASRGGGGGGAVGKHRKLSYQAFSQRAVPLLARAKYRDVDVMVGVKQVVQQIVVRAERGPVVNDSVEHDRKATAIREELQRVKSYCTLLYTPATRKSCERMRE